MCSFVFLGDKHDVEFIFKFLIHVGTVGLHIYCSVFRGRKNSEMIRVQICVWKKQT